MTDTQAIKRLIAASGIKYGRICAELGVVYSTLRAKINGDSEFTASEIARLCALLGMTAKQRDEIFFAA